MLKNIILKKIFKIENSKLVRYWGDVRLMLGQCWGDWLRLVRCWGDISAIGAILERYWGDCNNAPC